LDSSSPPAKFALRRPCVCLASLLFFSYGQVYSAFEGQTILGVGLFRHRILFPAFCILGAFLVFWIVRKIKQTSSLTYSLNLVSIFLLIYPLFTISSTILRQSASTASSINSSAITTTNSNSPDVYYIILDGYGRQDVLQREYGFDNTEFIHALRARGFYVADCSESNYAHTLYSLASSLNYDYLDTLGATGRCRTDFTVKA
jgi:hypothetical protein